jgi:hypothetical protein
LYSQATKTSWELDVLDFGHVMSTLPSEFDRFKTMAD